MASQSNQPNVSLRLHDPAKPGSTVAWTYVVSILGFHLIVAGILMNRLEEATEIENHTR